MDFYTQVSPSCYLSLLPLVLLADPSWSKGEFVISRGLHLSRGHWYLPKRPCSPSLVYGHDIVVSSYRVLHERAHGVESESMLWELHHIRRKRCQDLGVDSSMLTHVKRVCVICLEYFLILQRHHRLIGIRERVSGREHDLGHIRQIVRVLLIWTEGRL